MKIDEIKFRKLAPVAVRFGLVFVFVWFGTSQIMNQEMWVRLIPEWAMNLSGMSAAALVKMNGIFEIIAAVLLAFGIQIRIVALLLFLHLGMIAYTLGLTAVGVRDIGLMLAMLSVALHGADAYSYDQEPV
jgi:uncharacterized membrane protein YphA (DoxX/SURF4 family)